MSDARIRELERDAAQGDLDAAGRLLLERVRAGVLRDDRLALAAHLGHAGARRALCRRADERELDLPEWVERLAKFGQEACVRAALAAVRQACRALPEGRWRDRIERALEAQEAWVACPCPAHAEEARWAAEDVRPIFHQGGSASEDAPLAVVLLAAAIRAEDPEAAATEAVSALNRSLSAVWNSPLPYRPGEAIEPPDFIEVIIPRGKALVRDAIRDELLEWALA